MFVYLIRNLANGKCYIGKTSRSVAARWRQHKTEARIGRYNWPIYKDMREQGFESFEVTTLGACDNSRRLAQMERACIRAHNAVAEGYNQSVASYGGRIRLVRERRKVSLSDEHREKIAKSVARSWAERKQIDS